MTGEENIPAYLQAAMDKRTELERERDELKQRLAQIEEELRLLDRVARVVEQWREQRSGERSATRRGSSRRGQSVYKKIGDIAVERLRQVGRPLHRSELRRYVEEKGVVLPGDTERAKWAALSAALSRDPRVIPAERRGEWQLAEDRPPSGQSEVSDESPW